MTVIKDKLLIVIAITVIIIVKIIIKKIDI